MGLLMVLFVRRVSPRVVEAELAVREAPTLFSPFFSSFVVLFATNYMVTFLWDAQRRDPGATAYLK